MRRVLLAVLMIGVMVLPQQAEGYERVQREQSYQVDWFGLVHTIWARADVEVRKFGCGFAWSNSCLNFRNADASSMGWVRWFEQGAVTQARVKPQVQGHTWGASVSGVSVTSTGAPGFNVTSGGSRRCYSTQPLYSAYNHNRVDVRTPPGQDFCKVVVPVAFFQGGTQIITNASIRSEGAVQIWGQLWQLVTAEAWRNY